MPKQYLLYNRTRFGNDSLQVSVVNVISLDPGGFRIEIQHPEYSKFSKEGWVETTYKGRLYPTGGFLHVVAEDVEDLVFMIFNNNPTKRLPFAAGCILLASTRQSAPGASAIPCLLAFHNQEIKKLRWGSQFGILPINKLDTRIVLALDEAEHMISRRVTGS
jgi:hypothetical protein